MIGSVTYFESMGKVNTEAALKIAKKRALELGINTVVVPSGGYTAEKALKVFKDTDVKLVIVGFSNSFDVEVAAKLEGNGHKIIYADKHKFDHPAEAWELLRRFCEGMKVSVQIVLIATELGLIEEGVEVVSLGGTGTTEFEQGGGVDTAIVMEATKGENFFDIVLPRYEKKMKERKIKEFLCKPR